MQTCIRWLTGCLVATAASGACAARGDLIELAWTAQGSFSRDMRVAPGRFVEACGQLPLGTRVQWRFEAGAALDFNIHYHEGQDVRFPAKQEGVATAAGTLDVSVAQDYCWMWTNPSAAAARLTFTMQRQPSSPGP